MKKAEDTTGLSDEAGSARIETPQPGIDNAHRKRTDRGREGTPLTFYNGPRAVGHDTVQQAGEIFNAGFRRQASGILAGALIRFQRLDDQEEDREATLYASQSGEAWIGGDSRTVVVESISLLPVG